MPINLDVVVDTPEQSVDMKSGLESLQGVSDATRLIAETILSEKTPKRLSYQGRVRTNLKRTFKGSYGQVFDLAIYDDKLLKNFNRIGRSAFLELMQYFLKESLYQDTEELSVRAQSILDKLGDNAEDLVTQLRVSSLEKIHQISVKFNHDIRLRFRKNSEEQITIAKFNKDTAKVLEAKQDPQVFDLVVSITRLNINTGNGRLAEVGKFETVAFGFGSEYRTVKFEAKKLFSENLDYNNGLDQEHWKTLKISVSPIKLKDGKIVKYIVKSFYGD